MKTPSTTRFRAAMCLALGTLIALTAPAAVQAAVLSYSAPLTGPAESPPNASPGSGFAQVDLDDTAHTMRVVVTFQDLLGTVTAAHIHGPTVLAGSGTAGVATMTPTFTGFPAGVTAGSYDHTFDLTSTASFNAAFLAANGGTAASAEAALAAAIAAGKAYLNIHSSMFGGGEIRGFLTATATPTDLSTWGQVKSLYR